MSSKSSPPVTLHTDTHNKKEMVISEVLELSRGKGGSGDGGSGGDIEL